VVAIGGGGWGGLGDTRGRLGNSQAIVEQRVDDLDGEARGPVEAVPLGVIPWARVHVECDVGSRRRRRRPRLGRRARRARVCGPSDVQPYSKKKQDRKSNLLLCIYL
jgi:hypothetical protein